MKKLLSIAMCLCLILSTFTFVGITASADKEGYLHYSVSNGEATVTGYEYSISGDITIPPTLGGYPVTSIGEGAFLWCDSLKNVTIPDSVTTIGDEAFLWCDALESISIPNSVTTIGDSAFCWCDALESISIPDGVTSIGDSAFSNCDALASIDVSKNNKKYCSVDGVLFDKDKTTLIQHPIGKTSTGYTIPDSVKTIGKEAFAGCNSLTSVTIPNSVTSIGASAFWGCESLTSVSIPDSVTSIGDSAFKYCNENFVIIGYEGSYAHSYAQSNNIKFEKIEHPHKYTSTVTKQPTCAKKGVKTYTCECGDSYTEDIAPLGHKVKTVGKKSATYFAKGYTGDKKCSVCGKVVAKGKVVAQLKLKTPKFSLKGATKKFTVKYTKVSGATGFEVRYKLGSGKYKTVKVNTKKSISKVISKLKKGKYTVQVRAFVKSGSKTAYSSWASAKKVTVK